MNRSAYALGLAILAMGASLVRADPVDPVFSMGDPATVPCSTSGGTPTCVSSSSFVFGADALGGGVLSFVNDSGILFQNLEITVTEPSNSAITLPHGLFFNTTQYSSTSLGNGFSSFTIGLFNSGPNSEGGIPDGQYFTINLNNFVNNTQPPNPNGAGGWGPGTDFSATANTVPGAPGTAPEPASILLIAGGLGLVWFGTRQLRGSVS